MKQFRAELSDLLADSDYTLMGGVDALGSFHFDIASESRGFTIAGYTDMDLLSIAEHHGLCQQLFDKNGEQLEFGNAADLMEIIERADGLSWFGICEDHCFVYGGLQ